MRPYWKGYLKLALVSCPIALHAACSTAERIAFRQINKATGNRLRQQLIDEETREPVEPEHKGRGYEVAKGQYLIERVRESEKIVSRAPYYSSEKVAEKADGEHSDWCCASSRARLPSRSLPRRSPTDGTWPRLD